MKILGFDTSADACSVALGDGASWLEEEASAGILHSSILLPMIDRLLAGAGWRLADLDAIAFGAGPGSFTGLRISCGVAQGLGWGAAVGLAPVSSLLAIAERAARPRVVAAVDARMRQIYFAAYLRDGNGWKEASAPAVAPPAEAVGPGGDGWFGAGNAFALDPALGARLGCTAGVDDALMPTGRAVATLGMAIAQAGALVGPESAAPIYVRDRVALTVAERKQRAHA